MRPGREGANDSPSRFARAGARLTALIVEGSDLSVAATWTDGASKTVRTLVAHTPTKAGTAQQMQLIHPPTPARPLASARSPRLRQPEFVAIMARIAQYSQGDASP